MELFENITDIRKRKILRAALKEFSENGYAAASTRAITAEAGVSTGLLFYHFGGKEKLFLELLDYLIDFVTEEMQPQLTFEGYFERITGAIMLKLKLSLKYPDVFRVFFEARNLFPQYIDDIQSRYIHIIRETLSVPEDMKLREGVSRSLLSEIIEMSLTGLSSAIVAAYGRGALTLEEAMNRGSIKSEEYLNFFRSCFEGDAYGSASCRKKN